MPRHWWKPILAEKWHNSDTVYNNATDKWTIQELQLQGATVYNSKFKYIVQPLQQPNARANDPTLKNSI